MLPSDFPKWQNVYAYFKIWSHEEADKESILEEVLKKLVMEVRIENGRKGKTSFCIVDAQSTTIIKEDTLNYWYIFCLWMC